MEKTPDSHLYYFHVGEGSWRGEFSLRVHDWAAFRRDSIGLKNRLLVYAMVLAQRLLGRPKITSRLDAFPDWGVNGVATNVVRIKKLGITLYLLKEQYVLDLDGSEVFIHSRERFGPIPFLFRSRKRHPARIHEWGQGATYLDMPLLGTIWEGRYEIDSEGDHIDATLTCEWASASEVISRHEVRPGIRPARSVPEGRDLSGLSDVIEQLERQRDWYEAVRDRRAVFTHAYARITRVFNERIHTQGFTDPAWIESLDVAFAREYFSALDAYDLRGEEPPGWAPVFEAMSRGRTSVLEELILSMAAHIIHDLPLALVSAWRDDPIERRLGDFHLANDVLKAGIDEIQRSTAARYNPILRWLDRAGAREDEVLTNYGIRLARAAAWFNGERLRDPQTKAAALASLGKSTAVVVRLLLRPPLKSLRIVLRFARWVIRSLRIWPGRQVL